MRFFYLIAAHNEEGHIARAIERLRSVTERFPGSRVFLLDNGSLDDTWRECLEAQKTHPQWITALRDERKGIGIAFRMGLDALSAAERLGPDDWVVLAATDLPFGFSDLDALCARDDQE
ncbi:MAG: glycosyltransferase [Calothrix sp. SM1_5_4]|nr:glycosyltransferase [Calothrix sp. SM1_5_4]